MSQLQTLVLGLVAGGTILIGLPLGRMTAPRPALRQFLNSLATGILLFLVWDVLTHAYQPLEAALGRLHDGSGGFGPVLGYGSLFICGIGAGLLSLVYYENKLTHKPVSFGPGALAPGELTAHRMGFAGWSAAKRLALMIAIGIGLHNFGEGLAIGGSAATGQIALATVLVLGFGLHNATEGFGIVAPLAANSERPSWGFLLVLGLIGGGPTFLGTMVGRQFTSQAINMLFLTLAAGSIIYVVIQLLKVAQKGSHRELMYWGIFAGLAAGFITDMIVTAGGA